jgi:enamine deaminase RidA (YjgF/YER057c/UK114 family)
MSRTLVASTGPYASIIGFSRAVRVDNFISAGGTAPINREGTTIGLNDPAAQTRQCLTTIKQALEDAGASLNDVVRTRMLLTSTEDWERVAKVRGEYFKDIRPVDTVVEVSRFINPEWLVEIEVDAVIRFQGRQIFRSDKTPGYNILIGRSRCNLPVS